MATYESRFNTTTGDQTFTGSIDPAGGFTGTGGLVTTSSAGLVPPPTLMSDELATILGKKTYSVDQSTTYNNGEVIVASSIHITITSSEGYMIPYQVQDGSWRLVVNVNVFFNTNYASNDQITFSSVTTSLTQSILMWSGGGGGGGTSDYDRSSFEASDYFAYKFSSGTAGTGIYINGDVHIDAKPTWAY